MKLTIQLTAFLAACMLTSQAFSQDTTTVSSRVGENLRALVTKSDVQRQRNWKRQVTTRALNDTFVYRHEGRATTREEESSPVMIFHTVKGGRVQGGHVYQQKAR